MKLQTTFSLLLVFGLLFQGTSGVSQEKDKKKEEKKPRLELPDVLIYGTDTKIRLSGDKLRVPADSARLIKPYISYQPLDSAKMVSGEKEFMPPENQEKKLANEVLVTYGSYNMADLRLSHWQKWTVNDHGLGIQYQRSDGQYKDSQFDRLETTGRVSIRTSPVVKVRTEATYVLHRYGLQGSNFRERKATAWNIKGLIPFYFSDQASGSLSLWYQDLSLSSGKKDTLKAEKLNNHFLKLSGEYLWVTPPYQVSLSATFLNDSFRFPADSSGSNFMSEIGAQVLFQPSQNFSTKLSLNLQNLSINQVSQTRVSPQGKIIYSHKSQW
ncbi:MAG: hypothetical protein ONB05_08640, partial [candidate division KSB1 bacterium]|nr:hypothetical protein [candidate division KSB1 bacterium]